MTLTFSLRSTLALLALAVAFSASGHSAQAFTYDSHIDRGDGAALTDPDAASSSSGGVHFNITGGENYSAVPNNSPFLSSSNSSIGSPVVPYGIGAGTMQPRFLFNH